MVSELFDHLPSPFVLKNGNKGKLKSVLLPEINTVNFVRFPKQFIDRIVQSKKHSITVDKQRSIVFEPFLVEPPRYHFEGSVVGG